MTVVISKTDVTVTGFSKKSFGCCARHHLCEMGKKGCFYEEIDKEVPSLCAAFRRNNNSTMNTNKVEQKELVFKEVPQNGVKSAELSDTEIEDDISFDVGDGGQLSLF